MFDGLQEVLQEVFHGLQEVLPRVFDGLQGVFDRLLKVFSGLQERSESWPIPLGYREVRLEVKDF